jgi:hypothetical protein
LIEILFISISIYSEQSNEQPVLPPLPILSTDSKILTSDQQPVKQKRTTKNALEKSLSIVSIHKTHNYRNILFIS